MLVMGNGLEKSQPRDMSLSAPTALAVHRRHTTTEEIHHLHHVPKAAEPKESDFLNLSYHAKLTIYQTFWKYMDI